MGSKRYWYLAAVVVVCAVALFSLHSVGQPVAQAFEGEENLIAVSGEGVVRARPDIVFTTLGVEVRAKTAEAAQQQANEKIAAVLAVLAKHGIPETDIITSNYSLRPEYDYRNNDSRERVLLGYVVNHDLRVKVANLEKLGTVIDQAITAGANQAYNITFDISNRDELEKQALQAAVSDASAKAQVLAQAANVRVRGVHSINATGGQVVPIGLGAAEMVRGAQAADMVVMSGELEIRAAVTMTFHF
ncbi:MAG: SIMPL domain-containing protein [Bacillota bacterium]